MVVLTALVVFDRTAPALLFKYSMLLKPFPISGSAMLGMSLRIPKAYHLGTTSGSLSDTPGGSAADFLLTDDDILINPTAMQSLGHSMWHMHVRNGTG
jgi:hypothetical protein